MPFSIIFRRAAPAIFLVGVAYLLLKTWLVAGSPTFDFRYIWVAAETWSRGENAYGEDYRRLGELLVASGHVPLRWPYPPQWLGIALPFSLLSLSAASVAWNLMGVVLTFAASALIAASLPEAPLGARLKDQGLDRRSAFFLHGGAMATLQATALTLSVGQTSILCYFGACLLLFGLARARRVAAMAGLAILMLKPQIGAPFALALLVSRAHWPVVGGAAAISIAAALPVLVLWPTAPLDWLANLSAYDGMTTANAPQSTTGLRHLVWMAAHHDIGNMAALAATLAAVLGLPLATLRERSAETRLALVAAAVLALAPLHLYDFTLVGLLLFPLARARLALLPVAAVGFALVWRPDDVANVTGLIDPTTQHFVGTPLGVAGATILFLAVLAAAWRAKAAPRTAEAT